MESVPKTLDWVKARAECSIEHLFMLLAEVIDSDVKSIQARTERRHDFGLNRISDSKFIVVRSTNSAGFATSSGVGFERTSSAIEVQHVSHQGPRLVFIAKPSLDATGACRLEVGGQALELWQVSQKALEDLFFA